MLYFRYRTAATVYVPQYKKDDGPWIDFKRGHISGALETLCEHLKDLQSSRGWHYLPEKGQKVEDMEVIFKYEMCVCAFLGAAQYIFNNPPRDFNL